ncbi:helix-turn-helix transcriptional regulator [Nocardia amamiensis]|uniref:Helix-turn-helix transcriptional regulator n=1 Tax=Nocardia amamiensis TaxID=404578 RepID=A0ABS0CP13_9NOCA|nr:helix-turn-helix transcriptional regulator [Nocardia amamiensis]MBF6298281.1 helix-turn-helix transcriptional regulator [Nocardia amamiensis]
MSAEIRGLMGEHKMKLKDLADAADLKPTYLGDRLRDDQTLNLNDVEALAGVFGMTPLDLMKRAVVTGKAAAQPPQEPRGPLLTSTGSFTGPQSAEDDEMLRRAHAPRSTER